jgi:hypothetical protein
MTQLVRYDVIVIATHNKHPTKEKVLETASSIGSNPRSYSELPLRDFDSVLSSERALKITNRNCLKENLKEKEKLVAGSRWAPDTKTDWPTDCRS